jgi:hypothetical protein
MLLRHETTPGYAQLHRRQSRRRRASGQIATGLLAIVLIAAFVVAVVARPGAATMFALGIALVLYALASFGLEEPPPKSARSRRRTIDTATARSGRDVDEIDWEALEEPASS